MGRARKIVLSTRTFDKAGDATNFFRAMLNRYAIGDRASEEDARDLAALLERHQEKKEKIGPGIAHFEVGLPPSDAPAFSSRCFWVVRTDTSRIDFSYVHCLEARPEDSM